VIVAKLLAKELADGGVRIVFGIPGKESLRFCAELSAVGIRFVGARHETQAVMMADGYWRTSGRVAVALVAQGAGLANAIGGMACAARARSGVIVVSGDLLKSTAGSDPSVKALQDLKGIDTRVACEAVHVAYIRPASAETVHGDIRRAIELAASGNAVALAFPSDLFSADARVDPAATAGVTARSEPARAPGEPDI
jgi:acetolactate synthase I/II/III large subunit